MSNKEVEKLAIRRILLIMKRACVSIIILSIFRLPLFATTPWSILDDFTDTNLSSNWSNWDDSTQLDVWPDYRYGNQTLLNNKLSYIANDDAEQNGLIYLRPPLEYTTANGNGLSAANMGWWRNTQNTPQLYSKWTATFKVNINPNFSASNPNGIVEGGLLVRNQFSGYSTWPDKQGYWTGFGINADGRKYLATDMFGTGTSSDYYLDTTISSSELNVKVVFDFNLLTISSYFTEDLDNPGYFWENAFRIESIEPWGNQYGLPSPSPNEYDEIFRIGFGGYSANTTVPDGTVTMDDFSFNLIPEPSALSLLAIGLGGLAILRRRRS